MSNIQETIEDAAEFSNFAQRMKMEFWKRIGDTVSESTFDNILLAVWKDAKSIATQAVEEYKKELLEKLPEHVENGDSPRSSNPIDEYIWHEQNGKNSMLSRVKSLINKSN